jgi:hypothetical protein
VVNNKTSYAEEIICVYFDATSQIMIIYSGFVKYLKNRTESGHQLFVDFKKACDSFRKETLCNILTEFGIP